MKKRRAAKKMQTKAAKDTALIRECVIYAQSVAALHEGYTADPGHGDSIAGALGEKYNDRIRQALTKITAMPATTPGGLCSKARIVAVVFRDHEGGCLPELEEEFLKSFAVDVKNFLQPICNGQVTLQKPPPAISPAVVVASK
jgi:hypothetical protein